MAHAEDIEEEEYDEEMDEDMNNVGKDGDSDDSDMGSDDSDDVCRPGYDEVKATKKSIKVPIEQVADLCREKIKELLELQKPAAAGPDTKSYKFGQQIKRKDKKARRLILGDLRRLKERLKRKKRLEELKAIIEEEKQIAHLTPKTLENTREVDVTTVEKEDDELEQEEKMDAFAEYYNKSYEPKILVTSSDNPHTTTKRLVKDLSMMIPNAECKFRNKSTVKKVIKAAKAKGYTDIVFVNEDRREPNALLFVHLPEGPTAYFRLTNYIPRKRSSTAHRLKHKPEVILNNFTTRLGRTIARMFGALFHYDPEFQGRRVVTFHNQRDFIFFRHHRYEFKSAKKVGIRDMGPRFTLRLQWLQQGAFEGDYEWKLKRHEMETSRRRFFL